MKKNGLVVLLILLLIFINTAIPQTSLQKPHIKFNHIGSTRAITDKNIYSATVASIYQDRQGYMWFGTLNGLERYDGYNFTTFRYSDDSLVIDNTFPGTICEDKEGNIWIASFGGGIFKFNREKEKFTFFLPNPQQPMSEWCNIPTSLFIDRYDVLWVGTGNGFYKFNKQDGRFKLFRQDDNDPFSIGHNTVNGIYEDRSGILWLATGGGLDRLDRTTGKFYHYWHFPNNPWGISKTSKYWLHSIAEDNSGNLWLGADGLIEFNRSTQSFTHYRPFSNTEDIPKNIIQSLKCDNYGKIWLATTGGLGVFDIKTKTFQYYTHNDEDPESIGWNWLNSLLFDKEGSLWISNGRTGIDKIDYPNLIFNTYTFDALKTGTFSSKAVHGLYSIKGGAVLIHTNSGLSVFDSKKHEIVKEIPVINIFNTSQDISGNLLVCANGGLFKLDQRNKWTTYIDSVPEYESNITAACESNYGHIWVAKRNGEIFSFNPMDKTLRRCIVWNKAIIKIFEDSYGLVWLQSDDNYILIYNLKTDSLQIYSSSSVLKGKFAYTFHEDKNKTLWIGSDVGFVQYNREENTFTHYSKDSGFFGIYCTHILEDSNENFWLSSMKGVVKFDKRKNKFYHYSSDYGKIIFYSAGCKIDNGEMYFGGDNGIIYFHPDSIKEEVHIPPVVITSFRIFEKPSPVKDTIELSYSNNFISFEFACLNFINSDMNEYAYIMEGLDKGWINSGTRKYASYPNLQPGEYLFRVKGSNGTVWNNIGASIKIIILPPWWKTIWAYIFYIVFIFILIYFTWKMQLRRIKMKHSFEMSRFEADRLHDLDQMKTRFFTNISHEFRTPLTLILGPAKDIIDNSDDVEVKQNAGMIKRNAAKLYSLVNQLLDLSKLESGNMKLQTSEKDIIPVIKGVFLSFSSLAEKKKILLKLNTDFESVNVYVDNEKFEKILNNLLSNAFKFTPEGGQVTLNVTKDDNYFDLSVSDTGVGIPREQILKIFDRFYQVDGSHTRAQEGTGIGLALTKELVELHKGKIIVESNEGAGIVFTVRLPLGKDHLKPEEIIKDEIKGSPEMIYKETDLITESIKNKEKSDIGILLETDKPLLLVVEDNFDVRRYIISHLDNDYRILEAVDGEEGLEQSQNHIPDLVISDVMMPKMDGFTLCSRLKNDEKTSHIPVIMLTAKAASQDKIEGYETGADDYIMKPFEGAELKVRIKNLIETRRKLQEKFSSDDFRIPKELNPIDEQFLKRVLKVINAHLSEEEFSIEELGMDSGMSRGQVYKKIKALTGKSPSLFLRSIRLSKARKMLKDHNSTIAEIAYSVGFSSPAYFTKCFNEEFGYNPSKIIKS